MTNLTITQAVEQVLREDPKTIEKRNEHLLVVKVYKKLGHRCWFDFQTARDKKEKLPSLESILVTRRTLVNKKNKFGEMFEPEEGVTYEKPNVVKN